MSITNSTESMFFTRDHNLSNATDSFFSSAYGKFVDINKERSFSSVQTAYHILSAVIGVGGLIVNFLVIITLMTSKPTNIFIINQTIIDAVACSAVVTIALLAHSGGAQLIKSVVSHLIACYAVESATLMLASLNASQASLIVITLERYVKIVHPVQHRNHWRPLVTRIGLVAPWVNGVVQLAWMMSFVEDAGICTMARTTKTFGVNVIVWQTIMPMIVFVVCYSKILAVVRRLSTTVKGNNSSVRQRSSAAKIAPAPASKNSANNTRCGGSAVATDGAKDNSLELQPQHSQQQEQSTLSRSEKNVLKTMIAVITCFMLLNLPLQMAKMIRTFTSFQIPVENLVILTVLSYINVLLNPVIYAARFRVGKRLFGWVMRIKECHRATAGGTTQ